LKRDIVYELVFFSLIPFLNKRRYFAPNRFVGLFKLAKVDFNFWVHVIAYVIE